MTSIIPSATLSLFTRLGHLIRLRHFSPEKGFGTSHLFYKNSTYKETKLKFILLIKILENQFINTI